MVGRIVCSVNRRRWVGMDSRNSRWRSVSSCGSRNQAVARWRGAGWIMRVVVMMSNLARVREGMSGSWRRVGSVKMAGQPGRMEPSTRPDGFSTDSDTQTRDSNLVYVDDQVVGPRRRMVTSSLLDGMLVTLMAMMTMQAMVRVSIVEPMEIPRVKIVIAVMQAMMGAMKMLLDCREKLVPVGEKRVWAAHVPAPDWRAASDGHMVARRTPLWCGELPRRGVRHQRRGLGRRSRLLLVTGQLVVPRVVLQVTC